MLDSMGPLGRLLKRAISRSGSESRVTDTIFEELSTSQEESNTAEQERTSRATPDPGWKQRQNTVTIQTPDGQRTYARNSPVITGKMVEVSSSNVHSIGYRLDPESPGNSVLLVRYLHKRNGSSRPGAMYAYYNISPDDFQVLRRAASKGEWVWDELRIRGTRSGHQVPYTLKGIAGDGYVPRQAVQIGDEEFFVVRTVEGVSRKTGRARAYQSELPNQRIGRGLPNRGEPNRAAPNRGR